MKRKVAMKGNAHHKIYHMKSGKEQEYLIKGPLPNSINLKENGLEEKEKQSDADYFPRHHHEKVGPVGHLPHETDLYEEKK